MKTILFLFTTIAIVDDIVLSASLLPKETAIKHDVISNSSVESDRKGRQFWAPPAVVFYPGNFNRGNWPYQLDQQMYGKNKPFYESESKQFSRYI